MRTKLLAKHREYMQRDRSKDKPAVNAGACPCEQCGCEGNETCGHSPLNEEFMCALMPHNTICPCCHALNKAEK